MKEVTLTLSDKAYEQLAINAAAARKSPEQWILDKLFTEPESLPVLPETHTLLAAALDTLGFQRLAPEKARRLSELLSLRKTRVLSDEETAELHALFAEADTLELASL
ncbi:MAG: hypothetical protein AB7G75_17315 [Candidatus Binatia bacterium]